MLLLLDKTNPLLWCEMANTQLEQVMRKIRIEKITLNVGAGKDEDVLKKGLKLLKKLSGVEPLKAITKKRIPAWGLRPGLAIGCKITLRGSNAVELLKRLLKARENKLNIKQFDGEGNVSFGVPEYIDIPGLAYDPDIKIMGLEVAVTLERPGYHVKRRKVQRRSIPKSHRIGREEAAEWMVNNFGAVIVRGEETA